MPRSLKEALGFWPSFLKAKGMPTFSFMKSEASMMGVRPSPR